MIVLFKYILNSLVLFDLSINKLFKIDEVIIINGISFLWILVCLFFGLFFDKNFALFLICSSIIIFIIGIFHQLKGFYNILVNLKATNVATMVINKIKKQIKNISIYNYPEIYNHNINYIDILISNYCLNIFKNKEMDIELKVKNIVFLLQEASIVRNAVNMHLRKTYMPEKYIWYPEDFESEDIILKINNQTQQFITLGKVINNIFKMKEYRKLLVNVLLDYSREIETNKENFPLTAFILNLIENNNDIVDSFLSKYENKEYKDKYEKIIKRN